MRTQDFLEAYSAQASAAFEAIIAEEKAIADGMGMPPFIQESITLLEDFARGGKRMRGALLMLGFTLANRDGLRYSQEAVKASIAYEMLHACLLVHDDIMDRDRTRRGRDALHVALAKQATAWGLSGSPQHYGMAMALNTGDFGVFLALKLISSLAIRPERVITRAFQKLTEVFAKTAHGQALDITLQRQPDATEAEVMAIYEYKTAWYSVAGPLEIGAILADADDALVARLHDFAIPLGMAFQLEDDLLGLFGDFRTLGKPIGSDLREGKKTLVLARLLEMTPAADREFVRRLIGRRNLSRRDLDRIREMARRSGTLDYCTDVGQELVGAGKRHIPLITDDREMQDTLSNFADYMMERQW